MPGLVTTRRISGGGSSRGVIGSGGSGGSRGATQQLATNRQADIDRILGLFKDFGVSAKRDIRDVTEQRRADIEVDAIRRGLANLTIRQPQLGQAIRQGSREEARIDEQVAAQQAQFLAGQLIDPALIAGLTQGAAAAGTGRPVQATLPAGSSFTRPNLAESIRSQGRGGGSINSTRTQTSGTATGSPGTGARIVTGGGSFSPEEFQKQRQQGTQFNAPQGAQPGAQAPPTQPGAPPEQEQRPTREPPSEPPSGNQGLLIEVPTFTDVPGVVSKRRQIVTIPAGMTFEQAQAQGLIPQGAVKVG